MWRHLASAAAEQGCGAGEHSEFEFFHGFQSSRSSSDGAVFFLTAGVLAGAGTGGLPDAGAEDSSGLAAGAGAR
jgi:hypothetical protein